MGIRIYLLFRLGRWSRGLHVPRSAPLDPYSHFLIEGRSGADRVGFRLLEYLMHYSGYAYNNTNKNLKSNCEFGRVV